MSFYSDDPGRDADRFDRWKSEWLERRPICNGCMSPIQDDTCYVVKGRKYCLDCEDIAWAQIRHEYLEAIDDD